MYNEATLKYLQSKMPWLFMVDGKLINPDNLPTFAQMIVDAFIAGQKQQIMDIETKEYLQRKIIQDIEDMADDVSILWEEDETLPPISIIANLILFAEKYDINFWDIVKSNCSPYEEKRLKYIFNNNGLDGFK